MGTSERLERDSVTEAATSAEQGSAARRQGERLRSGFGLTEREATIATLICLGYSPLQLAKRLSLSTNTVRSHLKRIFCKTQTHRQADLVRLLLTTVFADSE